ncbi:MAG: DsbE family thiol:disulfide interchange protein [Betaproteobacteria bacterium]|nr:DsbE family thiol:disulfide interchange protein [Betaproteobacteria bacterium]
MKRFLPLGIFLVLAVFLALGLSLDPREVPSPLIDKAAPAFRLPQLQDPGKTLGTEDLKGRVWILNVWASWCVACLEEHPILVDFSKQNVLPIYGLNYKDKREDALKWLDKHGNPYMLSIEDSDGRVGIDYGVYGVPETYVIDRNGIIRYKRIGPVTVRILQEKILPLVRQLQG